MRILPRNEIDGRIQASEAPNSEEGRLRQLSAEDVFDYHEKLGFDYEVEMVHSRELAIQIHFENPEFVSASYPEDEVQFAFWGPFIDKETGLMIEKDDKI